MRSQFVFAGFFIALFGFAFNAQSVLAEDGFGNYFANQPAAEGFDDPSAAELAEALNASENRMAEGLDAIQPAAGDESVSESAGSQEQDIQIRIDNQKANNAIKSIHSDIKGALTQ